MFFSTINENGMDIIESQDSEDESPAQSGLLEANEKRVMQYELTTALLATIFLLA